MKNVSYAFKQKLHAGGLVWCSAKITLADGTKLEFNANDDFMISGNDVSEAAGTNGFPLGIAVAKSVTICIDNSDERYSTYDFYMARITLYTNMDMDDGTIENIREGTFTVTDSVTPGETLEITAVNDMYKADVIYTPKITTPTTLDILLQDVCRQCGILLGSATFNNANYVVKELPENATCRSVIGYVAQIAGGNAVCDNNNRLIIKTYSMAAFEASGTIDARNYGETVDDTVDAGDFTENITDVEDAGAFGENEGYVNLFNWKTLTVATDDVVITGVTVTITKEDNEDETYLSGVEGYTISIDNPLIVGNEKDAADKIAKVIVGLVIRPFEGEHTAFPLAEFMDPCVVWDKKDNMYQSFVTDVNFTYAGSTSFKNTTEPPLHNQSSYYSNATEAYRRARQEAAKQKSAWEKAMEDLSNRLENASGLFTTIQKQEDGSSIFYMHDKKTLAESMIIWKQTAEAWGVSTDGGKTWNAGMTVDGDAITRILNTIGVNADWIRTGKIYSKDYEEGVSGMVYDLDKNRIISYSTSNDISLKATYSNASVGIVRKNLSTGKKLLVSTMTNQGLTVIDYEKNIYASLSTVSLSISSILKYSEIGFDFKPLFEYIPEGKQFTIDGYIARTGTANFSDGSYLKFVNGILVGGKTATGGSI